jgi:hypothetical protein
MNLKRLSRQDLARLNNLFSYHSSKGDQTERYVALREKAKEFATLILQATPDGREQEIAIMHLQLTVMLANAAIACGESA